MPDDASLARGAAIGRFVVLRLVGRGGMGEVYAAYDPELDRNVAIKLLRTSQSDEGRTRLMREAQAIARVSHPNVVVVYDAGTFQDRVFIAMEFVEGHTLGHWMHARPRSWPEVLEVFSAAGRGLAAAHGCDLVHRDFKPDNVMIGADGQVRVMDFGLVQVASDRQNGVGDETALPASVAPLTRDVSPEGDREVMATRIVGGFSESTRDGQIPGRQATFSKELTQTGAAMGTPAYMSPEQFRGESTDASTDQFSFCVALYEALYRERPFAGRHLLDLSKNVAEGLVRDPPPGTQVPFWIREVLLRGLQARTKARWPSMNALLAELEKQPAVASRRRFATAAAAKLAEVWAPPKGDRPVETSAKAEIRHAFQSTGKVYAAQSFAGASRILDQYTRRWSELYVEACEATHVRGEQSAEVLDLRMGCLHEGLEDLKALCRMFQQATAEVVENAVNAANALGGLDRCEDIELLRALVKPPQDAGTRAAVERLRRKLAEVRALSRVGRINEGLAAAVLLEQEIRKLNYEPLLADTLMVVGVLHADNGVAEEAARAFEEALWTAVRCRHEEAAAEAATWLVGLIGAAPSDRGAGESWNRFAEAFLRRMGGHDLVWGWLFTNRAVMREAQGRLLEALEDARLSVAAKERALGPDHPDLGYSIGNMALYLVGLGQLAEAVEHARRAVEIVERGLGPNHPRTALHLSNYGECLAHVGRYEEAAEVAARALAVFERETDPGGRFVTYPLYVLGLSHLGAGRARLALPLLERANQLRSEKEPLSDKRAEARFALARALSEVNADPVRALSLSQQARDEYQKSPQTPATLRELAAIDEWLSDVTLKRQRA